MVKAERESNIELLRLLAMLMVLVIHATIGINHTGLPQSDYFISNPAQSIALEFVFYFCLPCVNLFVFISGWFGIRPSILGGGKLLFQALFFIFLTFLIDKFVFGRPNTLSDVKALVLLNSDSGYWFVKSYLFLYMLSPCLNAFIKSASKLQYGILLVLLVFFQTYFDIVPATKYLCKGYSPIAFCILYLIARFIKIYRLKLYNWSTLSLLLMVFLIPAVRTALSSVLLVYTGAPYFPMWESYDSIVLIFQTICMFLLFERLHFYSKIINVVAKSSFAVYLFHRSHYSHYDYNDICHYFYYNFNGVDCILLLIGFIISIYIISLLLDQLRISIWNIVEKMFFRNKEIWTYKIG